MFNRLLGFASTLFAVCALSCNRKNIPLLPDQEQASVVRTASERAIEWYNYWKKEEKFWWEQTHIKKRVGLEIVHKASRKSLEWATDVKSWTEEGIEWQTKFPNLQAPTLTPYMMALLEGGFSQNGGVVKGRSAKRDRSNNRPDINTGNRPSKVASHVDPDFLQRPILQEAAEEADVKIIQRPKKVGNTAELTVEDWYKIAVDHHDAAEKWRKRWEHLKTSCSDAASGSSTISC